MGITDRFRVIVNGVATAASAAGFGSASALTPYPSLSMATQIGNIGSIDVASRRASFAVLPALDAHGTVVPASFVRNCSAILVGKGGDAPTATNLGEKIALSDNGTCKATIASGDFEVTLLEVLGGNHFRVWIP